jgi:membrane fusion protein (multidrug efflux system)
VKRRKRDLYFEGLILSLVGICSLLLPALLAGLLLSGCEKEEKAKPQAPIVEVVEVIQKDVAVFGEWVGTLDGSVNATIRAQVSGYLIKQNYKEGDFVKKDQVLFEIDPRSYQAALEETKAQLAQTEARWQTAKANLARIKPLAEQNAVSKKDLDDAIGAEESTRASVMSAKATVDKAQLNLEWTKVTSLIDGITGIAKAQIGNLVGPGSIEELTTVSTVNPIKCYISLSEQEYMRAMEKRSKQAAKVPLELILSDGSTYPYKGEVAFADRQVDVRTGTIRVAAIFPNPQSLLRPGMFSRIRAEMGIKKAALVIPQRAVTEVQGRYMVAVVNPENKVSIKSVKVGQRFGQLWVVDEGLQAGAKVVAEGTQKVREDMVVSPKPFTGEAQAEPGAAQKPETKPEAKPEAKPQSKPEKR